MRCPDCSKFVPYNTEEEPEANLEISDEGQLTGDVRRVLTCEECSTELKETSFDVDQELNALLTVDPEGGLDADCAHIADAGGLVGDNHKWDWENAGEPEVSADMRTEDKDRNGKKITNSRYMTTYYGIVISGSVKCSKCGVEATYEVKDECAASSMDELT